MLAQALMNFYYVPQNLKINKGTVFEVNDPRIFLDLAAAGFCEQIERRHNENIEEQ
jgi:vacuolar-type H+-ATPase subunit E/Vma4